MNIVIDGKEIAFEEGMEDIIENKLKKENRVITKISVNDVDMVNASLDEIFSEREAGKTVRIETCPAEELIKESVYDAAGYIPKLQKGLLNIRDKVLGGDTPEAKNMLEAGLEGIDWVLLTLQALAGTIKHAELEALLEQEKEGLHAAFSDLETAMQDEDMIHTCDILEYEVIPFLEKVLPIIKSVIEEK